jgi:N-methylhydantoinase A/oxoprolinase/acetone carboxylase beta subunit
MDSFRDRLIHEIAQKALSQVLPSLTRDDVLSTELLDSLFSPKHALNPEICMRLPWPIIGIGAPAVVFIPKAGEKMRSEFVVPEHADVANAVGAIVGTLSIRDIIRIHADEKGVFRVSGAHDAPRFSSADEATAWAVRYLKDDLIARAQHSGCHDPDIQIDVKDHLAPSQDGAPVFVGREIHGHAQGVPTLEQQSSKASTG